MARTRVKKSRDKRIFTRTAKKMDKKNIIPANMRGGIRLWMT